MKTTIKIQKLLSGWAWLVYEGQSQVATGNKYASRLAATTAAMTCAVSRCEGAPGRACQAEIRERMHGMMTVAR